MPRKLIQEPLTKETKRKTRTAGINKAILRKDFITEIESWWLNTFKSIKWKDPLTEHLYVPASLSFLKQFIKKKKPELLGKALLWNPYLIEHSDIRGQIIIWIHISRGTLLTRDKEFRKYIEPFAKALIPSSTRTPVTMMQLSKFEKENNINIKKMYQVLFQTIDKEIKNFKKRENRKKLFQGDIASILKKRFKPHIPYWSDINGKTFNDYCENLAEKKRNASEIALQLLMDALEQVYGFKIGERNLKKFKSMQTP